MKFIAFIMAVIVQNALIFCVSVTAVNLLFIDLIFYSLGCVTVFIYLLEFLKKAASKLP